MRRLIASDYLFDGCRFMTNHALLVEDTGEIIDIVPQGAFEPRDVFFYPGLITPGFINAHCHLELSHLKGLFSTGTGLIPFLNDVVSQRDFAQEKIDEAIQAADADMWTNGIVAVGDISNKTDSIGIKRRSNIYYYTFVECFDFLQQGSDAFLKPYLEVFESFIGLPRALVPHAPYSVSASLFESINRVNSSAHIISIHNQEVNDEDQLFISKQGGFENFYRKFGFSLDHFNPSGKTSVHYTMEHLNPDFQLLLVHNTCMSDTDIRAVMKWNINTFFVTCPNANLFIENKLPDYRHFTSCNANLCIGTDSLSSNWNLSILEEIKTILKYQSYLQLGEVLQWATSNGAKALKVDQRFGSLKSGLKPGLNWIQDIEVAGKHIRLKENARVQKII